MNKNISATYEMIKMYKKTNKKSFFFYESKMCQKGKAIDFLKCAVL